MKMIMDRKGEVLTRVRRSKTNPGNVVLEIGGIRIYLSQREVKRLKRQMDELFRTHEDPKPVRGV